MRAASSMRSTFSLLSAALASLAFTAFAGAQTPILRVNCGGPTLVANGATFVADQPYAPGSFGYIGGTTYVTSETRLGPVDSPFEEVARRARRGFTAYRFDLPNAQYVVRLHLAEIELHGAGLRRFSVAVEGANALQDVDLFERFGHDYAGVHSVVANVVDGRLDIEASASIGQTLLNGIEIFRVDPTPPAVNAPTGISARWSYGANILRWARNDSPTVLGWRIEAAPTAQGPFTTIATQWSQPASFVDLGAPIGVARHYRVSTIGIVGDAPSSFITTATARDATQSQLPVYEISVDPLALQQLNTQFLLDDDFEVPATLTFEGLQTPCSLRYSGFTSGDDPKKSFKLRFNLGQTFQDRRELNLKSHFSDDSVVRQELSRQIYLAGGHPVPKATWVHVQLNGEFAGVFADLEVIEEDFLRHRELEQGPMYQAYQNYVSTLYPILNPGPLAWELAYKKKIEDELPHDDLIAFIDALTAVPQADFRTWAAANIDLDDYLDYLAATSVVADIEKIIRDYHLWRDPDSGRWSFITWDTDASWKQNYVQWEFGGYASWMGQNQLTTRVYADPVLRHVVRRKIQALLDGPASPQIGGPFQQLLDAQMALIGDDVRADHRKYGWEDNAPFEAALALLRPQVQLRHDSIETQFASQGPNPLPHALWLDEVMADNATAVADPVGEFEDWLEIVNASNASVDIGGHHLTDDVLAPTKWTFPAGTLVPAGGRIVVWCDNDLAQPGLHANFALSAGGELVALFAPGGATLLDVLHFGPQRADVALARFGATAPGEFWRAAVDPTPGAASGAYEDPAPWLRLVEHTPSAPSPTDAVRFSAHADDSGPVVVELRYRVGGGAFQLVQLEDRGAGYFERTLPAFGAVGTVEYWVRAVDVDGNDSSHPFDAPNDLETFTLVAPQGQGLRITEVCADNDTLLTDQAGDFEDFVEIRNTAPFAIDLANHFLTDNLASPNKWALPAQLLAPGARLLVWCDGEPAEGANHATFSLSKDGEEIGLYSKVGSVNTLVDGFAFGPSPSDTSIGDVIDGSTVRVRHLDPSPGASNTPLPGTLRRYDSTSGAGATLPLVPSGACGLAQAFTLTARGAPNSPAALAMSLGAKSLDLAPNQPLLVDLGNAFVVPWTTNAAGDAAFPFVVPPDPVFVGIVFYGQAAVGAQTTEAVVLEVGP
jgi:hypothetical protein